MFSHVMVGVNDLEPSRKFYDALLGTLGIAAGVANVTLTWGERLAVDPNTTFVVTTRL